MIYCPPIFSSKRSYLNGQDELVDVWRRPPSSSWVQFNFRTIHTIERDTLEVATWVNLYKLRSDTTESITIQSSDSFLFVVHVFIRFACYWNNEKLDVLLRTMEIYTFIQISSFYWFFSASTQTLYHFYLESSCSKHSTHGLRNI